MPLSVAIMMDPIGAIDIRADTTFRLAEEAQSRGHSLFYYTPDRMAWQEGRLVARGWPLELRREQGNHYTLGAEETRDLGTVDVIWMRQDPPFDMAYITYSHLLELVGPRTLVLNDPFWVRNSPEKLLVLQFPELTPPTAVARDLAALRAFREKHGDMILKPLYGNGGAGVFKLAEGDGNLAALHEMFAQVSREPVIVQKFLPDVTKGDKRIILVEGEPVGAINRVPATGETRSNMHVGGKAEQVALTERDREICAAIGPVLREKGLLFVGIDVIGDWLTEINVTSPTGLQELERFEGRNITGLVWDAAEARLAAKRG